MQPENVLFGGGAASTLLHPLVALEMALAIVLILCLPRKYVMTPLLLAIFTIPLGQVVVLGGAHFTMARILIVTGLARLLISRWSSPRGILAGGLNTIDRAFLLWAVFFLAIFSLQWMETQALIKSLGNFLDAVGAYLVMRFLIRERDDIQRTIKVFALICMFLGVCMINEQMTHQNIFGLLGGTAGTIQGRAGSIRSQGIFEVYLTAGVFGATLLPLFVWLWTKRTSKSVAGLGILGATAITLTSNSSTPLLAYVAGIVGLCLWPARKRMRLFRWVLVLTLLAVHLVMKAPVWALIGRVDLTGSSSSYHRFMLLNNCILHFSDWWLLGYKSYDKWEWDMWDLSNQYVAYALRGGLATLVMFILIISRSFGRLGAARKLAEGSSNQEWLFWCLGCAMTSHVVGYFGIGYFDQMQFAWYAFLAIICAAIAEAPLPGISQTSDAELNGDSRTAMKWEVLEVVK
jgi:hypothetical protein